MTSYDGRRYVTHGDRRRLGRWLDDETTYSWSNSSCRDELGFALERADVVDSYFAPNDVVTMNTTVLLSEESCVKPWTVTLVFPDDVDLVADGISVLDPRGTALLGRRVGDLIQWAATGSGRNVRIHDIVYQPELAGSSHL